jgi:CheY-like chemotaxis protein
MVKRLLLRAEVIYERSVLVTHTLEISESELSIAAEGIPIGAVASVALSFPGAVNPFTVECCVVGSRIDGGPGKPAVLECRITNASESARAILASLLALDEATPSDEYRCLLVEDNAFIRDLFAYGVRRYGSSRRREIHLAIAEDAESAWSMLGEQDFHMAIVDHYLPVQNGAQLIGKIRADPRLAAMPVVAISVGGQDARDASMEAGADLFLDKPIVLVDLFDTLDKLGDHHEERRKDS